MLMENLISVNYTFIRIYLIEIIYEEFFGGINILSKFKFILLKLN